MRTNIYALIQYDGSIRYIGKTIHPLRVRLLNHLKAARLVRRERPHKTHLHNWINRMVAVGFPPCIQLIEAVDGNGSDSEKKWIAVFREIGTLVNSTDGGDGTLGYKPTLEVREKLAKAARERVWSEESKLKISLAASRWQQGRKLSESHKTSMSLANLGRIVSEETRSKLRQKVFTSEHRAKIGAAHRGKILSSEHRQKLRSFHLGLKASQKTRAKMSATRKGMFLSQETRDRISRATTTTGIKGVYRARGKWVSQIWDGHKLAYLGCFESSDLAANAYKKAEMSFKQI